MRIAADIGSGFSKWCTKGNQGGFPSVVGLAPKIKESFQVQSLSPDTVEMTDGTFLVGESADAVLEDAAEDGAQEGARISTLTPNWSKSAGYLALLYRVFAAAQPKGYKGRAALCVGLPQAYYERDRPDLVERLAGRHQFKVDGQSFDIEIARDKLWVIPQSMGIFFYRVKEDPDLTMSDHIGVIDVGTYTTGYSMIDHGRFRPTKSGGLELGIANLTEDLSAYIARHHDGLQLPRATVTKALIRGKLRLHGKDQNLKKVVPGLADRLMDELVDKLTKVWGDDSATASILVAGGGAPYVLQSIQRRWPHATMVSKDSSERVIVDGYFAYMAAQDASNG